MTQARQVVAATCWLLLVVSCGSPDPGEGATGRKVETSGKEAADLSEIPAEVLAAARSAKPDLEIVEAEHEVRDGREYYDVGGLLPDGSEMELDMTIVDGAWAVVEFQRDIDIGTVPSEVRTALQGAQPDWVPQRIIESEQADGIVIYEFFGVAADGEPIKVEVKWDDPVAAVLMDEWAH